MKQIGHYLAIVLSGGKYGKPIIGQIPIFGMRFKSNPLLGCQVQVIAYGEYMWINVEPHSIEIYA